MEGKQEQDFREMERYLQDHQWDTTLLCTDMQGQEVRLRICYPDSLQRTRSIMNRFRKYVMAAQEAARQAGRAGAEIRTLLKDVQRMATEIKELEEREAHRVCLLCDSGRGNENATVIWGKIGGNYNPGGELLHLSFQTRADANTDGITTTPVFLSLWQENASGEVVHLGCSKAAQTYAPNTTLSWAFDSLATEPYRPLRYCFVNSREEDWNQSNAIGLRCRERDAADSESRMIGARGWINYIPQARLLYRLDFSGE